MLEIPGRSDFGGWRSGSIKVVNQEGNIGNIIMVIAIYIGPPGRVTRFLYFQVEPGNQPDNIGDIDLIIAGGVTGKITDTKMSRTITDRIYPN